MASDSRPASAPAPADVLGLSVDEIEALEPLRAEPRYRSRQVYRWLHARRAASFEEMTDLPAELRARLARVLPIPRLEALRSIRGADASVKTIHRLDDGAVIESVLMPHEEKRTLCVSTQVGCAVGCVFCATGAIGLRRHLTAGEILRQIYGAESGGPEGSPLTNVVLMGMGEPLHNYGATRRALANLVAPEGRDMSPRRITLSTSGYPDRIRRLAEEGPAIRLAISLTAPTDELRTELIPLNRRHPIESLLAAGRHYEEVTGRRVTYEYVLLAGVNDSPEHAERLARRLRGRRVNLIPFNPHEYSTFSAPAADRVDRFHRLLKSHRVRSTVRWSKGTDIRAACGQLAAQG